MKWPTQMMECPILKPSCSHASDWNINTPKKANVAIASCISFANRLLLLALENWIGRHIPNPNGKPMVSNVPSAQTS